MTSCRHGSDEALMRRGDEKWCWLRQTGNGIESRKASRRWSLRPQDRRQEDEKNWFVKLQTDLGRFNDCRSLNSFTRARDIDDFRYKNIPTTNHCCMPVRSFRIAKPTPSMTRLVSAHFIVFFLSFYDECCNFQPLAPLSRFESLFK